MKFCSACGCKVVQQVPEGDNRLRAYCHGCNTVHYSNPRVIVGCLPVHEGKVLLCRRAIEPRLGLWTLPAGYMENGETTMQGAARETWEEARARVHKQQLYRVFDLPHIDQIYMFYLCSLEEERFSPGPESLEVALFSEAEIPWGEMAFPVICDALREYFDDSKNDNFPVRVSSAHWRNPSPAYHACLSQVSGA